MPAQQAFAILISLLVALFPIAVYCMLLSSINRRAEPLLVRGVWDFGGVLFAGSGIVLWSVPMMFSNLYQHNVTDEAARTFDEVWWHWWLIWSGYYGLILTGGVFLLWLRRQTTAIYNVAVDLVPMLVANALQRLGLEFAQNAYQQFLIAPAKNLAPSNLATAIQASPLPAVPQLAAETVQDPTPYSAALEVDAFAPLCHATLHWYATEPRLRRAIEEELRKNLAAARVADNPASLWQFGISILLFGVIFLCILFYILISVFPRRL